MSYFALMGFFLALYALSEQGKLKKRLDALEKKDSYS